MRDVRKIWIPVVGLLLLGLFCWMRQAADRKSEQEGSSKPPTGDPGNMGTDRRQGKNESVAGGDRDEVAGKIVRGRVVDSAGRPVKGARVLLASGSAFRMEVGTLSRGTFEFLLKSAASFRTAEVSAEWSTVIVRGDGLSAEAEPIEGSSEKRVLDLSVDGPLDVGDLVLSGLVVPCSIRGKVRTGDGGAVKNLTVRLLIGDSRVSELNQGMEVECTGDEFAVYWLTEGEYAIAAVADGYAPSVIESVHVPGDKELTVVLQPGLSIFGTVVDWKGTPVPHVHVRLSSSLQERTATSDTTGRFVLNNLSEHVRDALLLFDCEGFFSERLYLPDRTILAKSSYDVVLIPKDAGGVARGRILKASSQYSGCTIELYGPESYVTKTVTADYVLSGVKPGTYTMKVRAQGHSDITKAKVEVSARRETVCDLELQEAVPLSGNVLDDRGQPVARATVRVYSDNENCLVVADAQGNFVVENAPVGECTLQVECTGYEKYQGLLPAANRRPATLKVMLKVK